MKKTPMIVYPILFVVVCVLSYMGVRHFTHEWGYKYTDEISRHPNHAEWYYLRGCSRETALERGIDAAGWAEQNLSDEVRTQREKMVLDDFSKVIELAPDCGPAYAHRAKCAGRTSDERGSDWGKVCELVPNDANAHVEYSRFLESKGQTEKAEEHRKIAAALSKN